MMMMMMMMRGSVVFHVAGCQEEINRGKPNWEHLSEDLHVLITIEDAQNRATLRLKKAADEVRKLLVPLVGIRRVAVNVVLLELLGFTIYLW